MNFYKYFYFAHNVADPILQFRLRCCFFLVSVAGFFRCDFSEVPLARAAAGWAFFLRLVEGVGFGVVVCFLVEAPRVGVGPLLVFFTTILGRLVGVLCWPVNWVTRRLSCPSSLLNFFVLAATSWRIISSRRSLSTLVSV